MSSWRPSPRATSPGRGRWPASSPSPGRTDPYGSYDELLADPEVDLVYNPTPNHLHVPWSIKALEAGKHVLCEKPIGLTAAEAVTLLEVARRHPRPKIMEGVMYGVASERG